MENKTQSFIGFGLILGLSIIISFGLGSYTFYKLRTGNTISVTGSAKKEVTSDKVKWTSSITRQAKASTIKDGYAKIAADLVEVKSFLSTNGLEEKDIVISPVFMNEIYDQNAQAEKNYNLIQNIEVQSSDIPKITELAKNTTLVASKGILFATNSLEYYYSKLADMRVSLLPDAIADAKARAESIATAGGNKIGAIKSASSGVVQVLSANSVEVSDYGSYDTSKIEKEIMVTVKASFAIN
ncbi:MAG: SIMPL domain-containing protein [Candidatus Nomurabacteria bacterium]|nr:SIMPL domain-containing protein [Candidatus Nomurabacteria bacterium]